MTLFIRSIPQCRTDRPRAARRHAGAALLGLVLATCATSASFAQSPIGLGWFDQYPAPILQTPLTDPASSPALSRFDDGSFEFGALDAPGSYAITPAPPFGIADPYGPNGLFYPRGKRLDLEVRFASGAINFDYAYTDVLDEVGTALASGRGDGKHFVIAGHTDARGDRLTNEEISQRRAQAVRGYLIEQFAIAPHRLLAVGYGESVPLVERAPSSAEQRRVEIISVDRRTAERLARVTRG